MTKFTTLSKKVSKKEVKTVFKYFVSSSGRNMEAHSNPDEWDEVMYLGGSGAGLSFFKAVDKDGSCVFYTGIKGTEFDD